jgi:hypothetical protein
MVVGPSTVRRQLVVSVHDEARRRPADPEPQNFGWTPRLFIEKMAPPPYYFTEIRAMRRA